MSSCRFLAIGFACAAILAINACDKKPIDPGPERIPETLERAWKRLNEGEHQTAADLFGEVLSQQSENAEAALGLGWSKALLGNYADAKSHLLDAAESESEKEDALSGLGAVYKELMDYGQAVSYCERLLDLDSSYSSSHLNDIDFLDVHLVKAMSHFRMGKSEYGHVLEEVNVLLFQLGLSPIAQNVDLGSEDVEQTILEKLSIIAELIQ